MAGKTKIGRSNAESPASAQEAQVKFGREICGVLEIAERREWLVTNGIGGFASGTVSGNLTRRYHGLLLAALHPPAGRVQLVAKLEEIARYDGNDYALATNRWASGAVEPQGYRFIESFLLDGTSPVWRFALGDALLEKQIWMEQGENTTYVRYTLLRGSGPISLQGKILVNYRDFHANTHAGDWQMNVAAVDHGIQIIAFDGATPFYFLSAGAKFEPRHEWDRDCFLPVEKERGLDDREDYLLAALCTLQLSAGQSATLVFSTNAKAGLDGMGAQQERIAHEEDLHAKWTTLNAESPSAPNWIRRLVLAADQFLVKFRMPDGADGHAIIAGYHWFGEWGRDTMIALPGLALVTGRAEIAGEILLAYARYVDGGMLPNNFPEEGREPQYNTVDAALWFIEAVRQYFDATNDTKTISVLYPVMAQIISAYTKGTRYHIRADENDGLLFAGEPGVQLTWMDAKVGDWVVTPRVGKPIEVNALWYNALKIMAALARLTGGPEEAFERQAERVRQSFGKFWNPTVNACYDVTDVPGAGNDPSLRPNQIFTASLPESPLNREQQKAVVDICARRLLTSHGLRSLAPGEPSYQGHYGGGPRERDAAYHQGTVWGWLLGPFVLAHLRVYNDPQTALSFLEPLGAQIHSRGLGTLGEIFDGDAPFSPHGCIAQAWTVAETLRAWTACRQADKNAPVD